ncbi:MAG: hypothetical protein J7K73_00350 [Nanoarchaeota archaeon]|nr:hypothetical protein [Nanoarchaeota archaeon]
MIERGEFQALAEMLDKLGSEPMFLELTGSRGTGKTTTVMEIGDYLIREGYVVIPVSPSGENALMDSFSDGALEELVQSSFEIKNIMLINGRNNLLMVGKEVSKSADSDIVASMLGAVENFVKDTFGSDEENTPEEVSNIVSFGDNTVVMYSVKDFGTLTVLLQGKIPDIITLRMKNVMDRIKHEYYNIIVNWNGRGSEELERVVDLFSPIEKLSEKKEFSSLVEEEYYFANRFFRKLQEKLDEGAKIAILVDNYDLLDKSSQNIIAALPSIVKSGNLAVVAATSSSMNLRRYATLKLGNFSYEDVKKLINSKFALKKPKEELIKYIYEQTKGNPLLVNENLDILLESNFDFWGNNRPSLITDFNELAKYKLSKLNEDEKKFLSYLSLFGEVGIKLDYVEDKQLLYSLSEKGYLVVDRSISFKYMEMEDLLRQEVSDEDLLIAADKLEEDGKYKNALSLRIEYLKKTEDNSQKEKILSGLSSWVSGMKEGILPLENPFPLIEELVDIPGFKDSPEFLKIIDDGLFSLTNSGSLDEQERIISEVIDFAESVGSDDVYARASYMYIRIKYKKRKFNEALSLIDETLKKWKEKDISEERYVRLKNTKLAVKKELGKTNKDVKLLREVVDEVNTLISEKDINSISEEWKDIILELYRIGLSVYSNIEAIHRDKSLENEDIFDETYRKGKEAFFKRYEELLRHAESSFVKVSMLRLFSIYNLNIGDIGRAYELINEAKKYLTPNNLSEAFMSAILVSYLTWVNGHPEETVDIYNKWYPAMLAFGYSETDYLKGNYLVAQEILLKEEERSFIKTAVDGARRSLVDDMKTVIEKYSDVYKFIGLNSDKSLD